MGRPQAGRHVRLRSSTLKVVHRQYPGLTTETLWRVETVNGGYGRDALHLVEVVNYDAALNTIPLARRIVIWRGQAVAEPFCEYCSREGHSSSTGTAETCAVRAAEVAEVRKAASNRMKEWNAKRHLAPKGEAEEPPAEEVPF